MLNSTHRAPWKAALLLAVLFAAAKTSPAQAYVTAQRGAAITPFVQTTMIMPDWGTTNNIGYTLGIDYTRFIRSIVQPSLELRVTDANGVTVSEHSYTGGLKLQTPPIRFVHPYITALAGKGFIDFAHPVNNYISDSSFIVSFGGGADITIHSQWDLRLDYTHQQWNIEPQTLTPVTLGVGIAYRIPFHGVREQ